jgi:hypothetical protein
MQRAGRGGRGAVIQQLVERHGLESHPEGGFYRRVFDHPDQTAGRPLASAIVYLLPEGVRSAWHRIDAVELWHAGSGAALELTTSVDGARVGTEVVGSESGQLLTAVVPGGTWQSARSLGAWSLVSITVVPAFTWDGFELAPPGWEPDGWRPGAI